MRSGDGDQREARADGPMTVSSRPPSPPDNPATFDEPPATAPARGWLHTSPRPRRRVAMIAAVAGFVLVVTLLVQLTNTGQTTAHQTGVIRPTATVTPSPTATILPSPTAMDGFKVYADLPDSFVLQYPTNWVYHPIEPNLGVEFDDSTDNNSNYTMQILVPGEATTPGSGVSPNDPSAWVQYLMDRLATSGAVQQETGPLPAKNIGGEVWQSGIARVTSSGIVARVDVYATIHNGKPYIITLASVDDHFNTGSQQFFEPMLSSFQFLPPTP